MRINGKNRRGRPENTCEPRKRTTPTKAEKRLQKRIDGYNETMRRPTHKPMGPETNGYHRPGSRQL